MQDPPLLQPLSGHHSSDPRSVGYLGANLAELSRTGLPVAAGFCVTAHAFSYSMERVGQRVALRDADSEVSVLRPLALASVSRRLQEIVLEAGMPRELSDAITRECGALGGGRFWVRASNVPAPTSLFNSRRGPSYGNVSAADVWKAVQRCWLSIFTQRALGERAAHASGGEPAVAVVVQRMPAYDKSGVMFTADPMTGDRALVVIDSLGLDEVVPGARVDPNVYAMDKRTRRMITRVCYKSSDAWSSNIERHSELMSHERVARVLDDSDLSLLTTTAQRFDEQPGEPQKVLWALAAGALHILRSRRLEAPEWVTPAIAIERASSPFGRAEPEFPAKSAVSPFSAGRL
jgi:pyruvate,water dikinase